jgi:energy-converting hydrogenase B subunit D
MVWVIALMVILILATAAAALVLENFIGAVVAAASVSLGVSVLFVLLRAPDVALTEAAVGAGLAAFLLALALKRLGLWRIEVQEKEPPRVE